MNEVSLQLAGVSVEAISIGGLETCLQLPGFDLCLDIGRCPPRAVSKGRVAFTHAHIDHLGGAVMHCATRSLMGMTPPTYVMPSAITADFEGMLAAWRRLDRSELRCTVLGLDPGEELRLSRDVLLRPFRAVHVVPCHGYVLVRERKKLRDEWVGRPERELRDARLSGVEISELVEVPEVAFSGDSKIDFLERCPAAREASLLMMEVTFVDDRVSVQEARDKGHVHLDEVIERAELFGNKAILFTHLSARYATAEAQAILDRRLPPGLRERVTLLSNGR